MRKDDKRKEKRDSKLRSINKHINFSREGKKGNTRKGDTTVFCSRCRKKTILPFRPRNPQVYCDECFKEIKKKR